MCRSTTESRVEVTIEGRCGLRLVIDVSAPFDTQHKMTEPSIRRAARLFAESVGYPKETLKCVTVLRTTGNGRTGTSEHVVVTMDTAE